MKQVNVTDKELKAFCKQYGWGERMRAGGLDSFDNYIGPDLGNAVIVYSRSRDSELLVESNFETILAHLKDMFGDIEDISVERFGHWACGWVESIMINPLNRPLLVEVYQIRQALNDYPVFDEGDYFEREADTRNEAFDLYGNSITTFLIEICGFDVFTVDEETRNAFESIAQELAFEDMEYHGEDYSSLFDPKDDDRTFDTLSRGLYSVEYSLKSNPAFELLSAVLGVSHE